MDVAFEMVDCDQRQILREGERFGVSDADQQRPCQARARGDSDGVEIGERDLASASAARTTGTMARRCSRLASSGTTPP